MSKPKPTYYAVTDSRGKAHTRRSHREYRFCVVYHLAAYTSKYNGAQIPARSGAEWAARRDLAEAVARRWRRFGDHCEGVEIIEVYKAEVVLELKGEGDGAVSSH